MNEQICELLVEYLETADFLKLRLLRRSFNEFLSSSYFDWYYQQNSKKAYELTSFWYQLGLPELSTALQKCVFANKMNQRFDTRKSSAKYYTKRPIHVHARMKNEGGDFVLVEPEEITCIKPSGVQSFSFSSHFDRETTNENLFSHLAPTNLASLVAGQHHYLMVYGQTGSGKTHTVLGPNGLLYKCIKSLLELNELDDTTTYSVFLHVSEVYNEKETPVLWKTQITDNEVLANCLKNIKNTRKQRTTHQNDTSSRSHAIFHLELLQNCGGQLLQSTLYMIDLAGSERLNKYETVDKSHLMETVRINQSLLTLTRCIRALANNQDHVPYRDSKLTMIMSAGLANSGSTMDILLCCKPSNVNETYSTLKFGQEAAFITLSASPASANQGRIQLGILRMNLCCLKRNISVMQADWDRLIDRQDTTCRCQRCLDKIAIGVWKEQSCKLKPMHIPRFRRLLREKDQLEMKICILAQTNNVV